jgi:MFS family permease
MMIGLTEDSGAICGAPAAAWVADRFGRRVGMFLGGLIILAGMAIAASAKTIAQVGYLYALHLTLSVYRRPLRPRPRNLVDDDLRPGVCYRGGASALAWSRHCFLQHWMVWRCYSSCGSHL